MHAYVNVQVETLEKALGEEQDASRHKDAQIAQLQAQVAAHQREQDVEEDSSMCGCLTGSSSKKSNTSNHPKAVAPLQASDAHAIPASMLYIIYV
jgi:hypothetical protein